jgi:glyoxylase-like metal-dependent hydrolase (beta-lactamase superfamily II)
MNDVELLIEGYAGLSSNSGIVASSATVLIQSSGKIILVDPGCNAQMLFQSLESRHLAPDDIDMVFLTHYHPDHFLNIRFFPHQDVYDGTTIYRKDEEISYSTTLPGTEIEVVATPGHAFEHSSLLVKTPSGKCAIAGDVFWWEDNHKPNGDVSSLMELDDRFAQDLGLLKESRRKLLSMADFVIPGHGKLFKVLESEMPNDV